jgi:hypothetical protein
MFLQRKKASKFLKKKEMVNQEALQKGDILGSLGLNFNAGLGVFGNVLFWVLIICFIVGIIGGIIAYVFWRKSYGQQIWVFGVIGNRSTLKVIHHAKVVGFGGAGDFLYFIRERKKYIAPPTIQMGKNIWWYWERKDGELINIGLGDIDEQMKKAGAYFIDTDIRMTRLGIEKNLRDRLQKTGFWAKYGQTILGIIFVIMVTVALVILFSQLKDVSKALEGTASAIQKMAEAVNKFYDAKSGNYVSPAGGLVPAGS